MRMLASNHRGLGPIPDPDVTNKLTLLLFFYGVFPFLVTNKKIKKGKSRDTERENPLSTCPLLSMIWSSDVRLNKKFSSFTYPQLRSQLLVTK